MTSLEGAREFMARASNQRATPRACAPRLAQRFDFVTQSACGDLDRATSRKSPPVRHGPERRRAAAAPRRHGASYQATLLHVLGQVLQATRDVGTERQSRPMADWPANQPRRHHSLRTPHMGRAGHATLADQVACCLVAEARAAGWRRGGQGPVRTSSPIAQAANTGAPRAQRARSPNKIAARS